MMKKILFGLLLLSLTASVMAFSNPKVFFITPKNNDTVAQTFDVIFGVEGMTVAKAGELKTLTGHHHIIIDGKEIATGLVVPKDETHKHFGDGQTKATLTLKPGKHTLTLQFADGAHKSYGEGMSSSITVNVK
jgi:hypothetical protein